MDSSVFNVYANALLEIAISKNETLEIRNEIKEVKRIIKENNDFVLIMHSKALRLNDKYKIIDKVFESCNLLLKSYLKVLIKSNLTYYFYDILKETLYRFDDYLNIEEGTLFLSSSLNEEDIDLIKNIISKKINKKLDLKVLIDKNLIGGFKVVLRNDVFDSSIITRINNFKKALKKE